MVVVVGQDGPCERFSVAIRQQFFIFRVMRSRAPHPCGDATVRASRAPYGGLSG